ncbi:MAG: hypothetical protein A2804_00955 [Candidatus Pacebacteria bacterium RIFCSPHIGHO2_01_FULL_46_10]|nr:MAG: hypothetical protein A2804_00955 [Candidatus Pacebacteria bacterium RIFCSPHIGHO2_01_FULL_46_10]
MTNIISKEKTLPKKNPEELESEHEMHNVQARRVRALFTLQLHNPSGDIAHDATAEYEVEKIVGKDLAADLHFWYVVGIVIELFNARLGENLFSENNAIRMAAKKLILDLAVRLYNTEKQNKIDPLTNLFNRRKFEEEKPKLLSEKRDFDYCVVMIDLDDFKAMNDTYGHIKGDELLRGFAQRLEKVIKTYVPSSALFRYGGEEFTCLIPLVKGKNQEDVRQELERIFHAILQEPFVLNKRGKDIKYKLSLSVGVAFLLVDTHLREPEYVVDFADEELYKAKLTKPGKSNDKERKPEEGYYLSFSEYKDVQ